MKLKVQKRIAAEVFGCSPKRVRFDTERLGDIKKSITKEDIKGLIEEKAIYRLQKKGVSRVRANKIATQKRKGRRKGPGSKKGKHTARLPKKRKWVNKIRAQRQLLSYYKDKELITKKDYNELYMKSKGGFFRDMAHIKVYIKEHGLLK